MPISSDINDISDPKVLVKNDESINEVWSTLAETYKNNIDKFDKGKSETFVRNLNSVINDYILDYTYTNIRIQIIVTVTMVIK